MKVKIVRNRQVGSQTLTVTATRGEEFDYARAQWLGMGQMAMLAFRYEANDRETLCYYDVTGSVPLQDAARSGLNDTVYMGALLSAAAVLGECESQGIAVVCVLWEPKHVFVGPDGGVRFALVPLFGADAGRKNTVHTLLAFLADGRRVRMQSQNGIGLQQALGGFLAQNPTVSAAQFNGFLASMGLISPVGAGRSSARPSFTQASSPTQAASPTIAAGARRAPVDDDPFGATIVGDAPGANAVAANAPAQSPLQQLRGVADLTGGTGSGFTGSYTGTGSGFTGSTGPTESFGQRPMPQPVISDETVASSLPRRTMPDSGQSGADETVASVLPRHTQPTQPAQSTEQALPSPVKPPQTAEPSRPVEPVATPQPVRTPEPVPSRPVAPSMPPSHAQTAPSMPAREPAHARTETTPNHASTPEPAPESTPKPVHMPEPTPEAVSTQARHAPQRDFSAVLNGDKPRPQSVYKPVIRTNPAAQTTGAAASRSDSDNSEGETSLFGATEHDGFEVTRLRDGRRLTATGAIARKATIGRSKTADLHMGGNTNVSRIHATIEVMGDGRFSITDNDSANGTSVRGREMAPGGTEYLSSGEDFALADDTFVIRAL
ncbi:FHA domain-containing protein [Bifidobacterium parmae]|uniref:FHA domain-containing protein n=1 Tax=Bifidobacterium parmae TaxID=361854 RepID=A0A2N5J6L4_9BIFI|nr:FHA domain-containing protein [Bifidobacterium parmae]PLS29817.1 FHA domain-containing protein [Bifidobacterium parmae]